MLRDAWRAIEEYGQALQLWRGLEGSDRIAEVRLNRKIVQAVTDLKWSVSLENLRRANSAREKSRASLEQVYLKVMADAQSASPRPEVR